MPALLAAWDAPDADRAARKRARKAIVAALSRGDQGVRDQLLRGIDDAPPSQRALRLRVLGRMPPRVPVADLPRLLTAGVRDDDPRVVREAARALGKSDAPPSAELDDILIDACRAAAPPQRRALIECMGRVGSDRALAWLRETTVDDAGRRFVDEALVLLQRRIGRSSSAALRANAPLPGTFEVLLRCRDGAAEVVADQLAAFLPGAGDQRVLEADRVGLRWGGTLSELRRVRTAIDVALDLPLPRATSSAERIAAALCHADTIAALEAWTEGTPRFRLSLSGAGRRRAVVRDVARLLSQRGAPIVNDSREALWTVEADLPGGRVYCRPRADERFSYRRQTVPAASHPSLAATLAWVGQPHPGERVWDPFCGGGTELIECAKLQPGLALWGTDHDPDAVQAARVNLKAASVSVASARFDRVDAREAEPGSLPISLIVCNPPMGRRVARDGTAKPLLEHFVSRAASLLAPQGRLVWVSPFPRRTAKAGHRAGLRVRDVADFDMSGFVVKIQTMTKP